MGLRVVAVDVSEEKLALGRALGADLAVDARSPDAVDVVVKHTAGGAHGVLVTVVSVPAFGQARSSGRYDRPCPGARRLRTCSCASARITDALTAASDSSEIFS
jgi:threonine dehydrogenase-like Zn-dependent dehydrogenase